MSFSIFLCSTVVAQNFTQLVNCSPAAVGTIKKIGCGDASVRICHFESANCVWNPRFRPAPLQPPLSTGLEITSEIECDLNENGCPDATKCAGLGVSERNAKAIKAYEEFEKAARKSQPTQQQGGTR